MSAPVTGGGGTGLLTFTLASLLVIGLAYMASRFLASWQAVQTRGRRMRVLEGLPIGRDRNLMLVVVGKEVLVVGSSGNNVSLVHQVTDPETVAELLSEAAKVPAMPTLALPKVNLAGVEESVRSNLDRMKSLLNRTGGGAGE